MSKTEACASLHLPCLQKLRIELDCGLTEQWCAEGLHQCQTEQQISKRPNQHKIHFLDCFLGHMPALNELGLSVFSYSDEWIPQSFGVHLKILDLNFDFVSVETFNDGGESLVKCLRRSPRPKFLKLFKLRAEVIEGVESFFRHLAMLRSLHKVSVDGVHVGEEDEHDICLNTTCPMRAGTCAEAKPWHATDLPKDLLRWSNNAHIHRKAH
jgi:hypothetical protein